MLKTNVYATKGSKWVIQLINSSDSTFEAERQDGSLIMIQEALNEKGNWKPLEYWTYSGCGNSYFNPLSLKPKECVLIPILKQK